MYNFINHPCINYNHVEVRTYTFIGNVRHIGFFNNITNAKIAASMLERESIVDSIRIIADNGVELTWKRS